MSRGGDKSDNACQQVPADIADNTFTDNTTLRQGYMDGVTPNPDVACNREIKFKVHLPHSQLASELSPSPGVGNELGSEMQILGNQVQGPPPDLGPDAYASAILWLITQMPDWGPPFRRSLRAICTGGLDVRDPVTTCICRYRNRPPRRGVVN